MLTNCKRLAPGFDLAYSITFPFFIQEDTIWKEQGSIENETPNKGKILGCERRFQVMISRQNRCQ